MGTDLLLWAGSAVIGRSSTTVVVGVGVPAGSFEGTDGQVFPAAEVLTLCLMAAGGQMEELAGSDVKLTPYRLDMYSSGSVPTCFGLL